MMEWEKKDDSPVRLKYKVVLNGASAPKNFLRLVLDPAEGNTTNYSYAHCTGLKIRW